MEECIRTESLTKRYGRQVGVVDLDLTVGAGEVFGYLGPNGAGKTTTIRLLLDLIRPSAGRVELFGLDSRRHSVEIRRRVGYLPGELALYERLTGDELLTHFAHLRGGVDRREIVQLADRLELDLARPIHTLSKGNKQKIGIVQALMHRPDLVVVDEPTSGLDPLVQLTVLELLREVRDEGRTVFLSSHALAEVERVADRVGILKAGRIVAVEEVAALKERAAHRLEARFATPVGAHAFDGVPGVRHAAVDGCTAHLLLTGSMAEVVRSLARFEVVDLTVREPDLEEIFLAYYGNEVRDAA